METKKKTTSKKKPEVNENISKAKEIVEKSKTNNVTKKLDELSTTELKAAIFDRQEQINMISREVEVLRSVLNQKLSPKD
jgi:hypothetical protein